MSKKNKRHFAVAILLGLSILWVAPIVRSVNFMREASAYFGETSSVDAAGDLFYARMIFASYLSMLITGLMWASSSLKHRRLKFLIFPLGSFLAGAFLQYNHVERPVHLIPDVNPYALLIPSTVLTIWGAWLLYRNRDTQQTDEAACGR